MDLTQIRDRIMKITGHKDADDVDDEINMVQRQYIQPAAKLQATAQYTTIAQNEAIPLASIATNIHEITQISDITAGANFPTPVPLLKGKDVGGLYGARKYGNTVHLRHIGAGTVLSVAYEQRLQDLGGGEGRVTTPEIEERWHDLYWLGALALIIPEKHYPLFKDRLDAYGKERTRQTKWLGGSARIKLREVF